MYIQLITLFLLLPVYASDYTIPKSSVQLPRGLQDSQLILSGTGYRLESKSGESYEIPPWNMDPQLREMGPESLRKFVEVGWLKIRSDNLKKHNYSLEANIRIQGGLPGSQKPAEALWEGLFLYVVPAGIAAWEINKGVQGAKNMWGEDKEKSYKQGLKDKYKALQGELDNIMQTKEFKDMGIIPNEQLRKDTGLPFSTMQLNFPPSGIVTSAAFKARDKIREIEEVQSYMGPKIGSIKTEGVNPLDPLNNSATIPFRISFNMALAPSGNETSLTVAHNNTFTPNEALQRDYNRRAGLIGISLFANYTERALFIKDWKSALASGSALGESCATGIVENLAEQAFNEVMTGQPISVTQVAGAAIAKTMLDGTYVSWVKATGKVFGVIVALNPWF